MDCFILAAGDGERLPQGMALSDFHGVAWTGSPLSTYETKPAVKDQIEFRSVLIGHFKWRWNDIARSRTLGQRRYFVSALALRELNAPLWSIPRLLKLT